METFEIIAKKSKQRGVRRTIWISLGTVVVLGGIIFFSWLGWGALAARQYHQLDRYYADLTLISFPNLQLASSALNEGNGLERSYRANLTKDLDGVPLPYETIEAHYSALGWERDPVLERFLPYKTEQDSTSMAYSYKSHQKVALFFNPQAQYGPEDVIRKPAQELPYLSQMKGQLVEVALSFDRLYPLAEIAPKLPKNSKINWYWIGSSGKTNPSDKPLSQIFGWTPREDSEEESYQEFYSLLEKVKDSKEFQAEMSGEESILEDINLHLHAQGNLQEAKFGGVIVTGKAEDLATLEGQSWIYAASIGASTPNQPYYQLEVE